MDGFIMSIQYYIDGHKSGKCGAVYDIGLPWEKCANDEEVIQYINYCFKVIELSRFKMLSLSVFSYSDHSIMCELLNEIGGAHNRIETCYRLLNGNLSKVMNDYVSNVRGKSIIYTSRKF